MNDVATKAKYKILRGKIDPNSAGVDALHNDKMPAHADQPEENFFFAAGTDGGCLAMDLWHRVALTCDSKMRVECVEILPMQAVLSSRSIRSGFVGN